jgi:2-phosphosulfolactate phosphatase
MKDPRNQPQYQVRFGFGPRQARELSPGAYVLVWADALANGSGRVADLPGTFSILAAGTGAASAVANWVLAQQVARSRRLTVAVIAAGGSQGGFTVDGLLAAGAIIDALADAGLDYISPEAASAVAAFMGLKSAHDHLLSASVAGQLRVQAFGRESLDAAIVSNAAAKFEIVRE